MWKFEPFKAGKILDKRYKIIKLLGAGNMGAVYEAERKLNGEPLAIKQSFQSNQPRHFEAFEREARLLAQDQITHPTLPKVKDYFEQDDSQFMVMELVRGEDLSSRFNPKTHMGTPMSLGEAICIAEQLLDALEFLHGLKILHRDLKPANLKFLENGQLKVLDFGAAKGIAGIMEPYTGSISVHSPAYAAPEQIHGLETDERTDLFSAAATLYHLLAGKLPKDANKREKKLKYSNDPLIPLDELNPKVPFYIASVLHEALAIDPKDRPKTAAKMKKMLQSAITLSKPVTNSSETKTKSVETELKTEKALNDNTDKPITDETKYVFERVSNQQIKVGRPPDELNLPPKYLYISTDAQQNVHQLFRETDQALVQLLPFGGKNGAPYLIDKFLVTSLQFAKFLNDLEVSSQVYLSQTNNGLMATSRNNDFLLLDANDAWKSKKNSGHSWGVTVTNNVWHSLPGSELLPVTFVTAYGASLYAAWANDWSMENVQVGDGLPSEAEWLSAALWDFEEKRRRLFPWGDKWDINKLNSVSYWARRNVEKSEEIKFWESEIRPTRVGQFSDGASACGLLDIFGNVWEWLSERDGIGRQLVKGGAYASIKTVFEGDMRFFRQDNLCSEMIGFRCCRKLL